MWAFSATLSKSIVSEIPPLDALFFALIFSSMLTLLYEAIYYRSTINIIKDIHRDWKIISFAGFANFIYSFLYFFALSFPGAKVSVVIPIFRFYVFLEILIGGKLLHERHLIKKAVASAVMLLGMFSIIYL